jgi:hypothetical protein
MGISDKPLYAMNSVSTYGGPFVTAVTSVLRANGTLDTNTAVASDPDGSYQSTCPLDLGPAYAQLAGTPQCLTIHVAGEACSSYPTANELAWSPCPRDKTQSMLQPMAVGDYVTEVTTPIDNERLIILKKTVMSPTDIELVLQRLPGPYCGILPSQRVHPNGWKIEMAASGPTTCEGGLLVVDIPGRQVYLENRFLLNGHVDFGAGVSSSSYALVGQGGYSGIPAYAIRETPSLAQIGQPANTFVTMDPKFSGVNGLSLSALQSYASKHQWLALGGNRRWALDFRHLNGPYGYPQDSPYTALAATTTTLVTGTSHVYKTSIVGDSVNVKKLPLQGFAGKFLLAEKSGPAKGDTLTDTDTYRFCYAYSDGECRHDSKAGEAYVSVPAATITGYCQTGQLARNIPYLISPHSLGAWAVQFDTTVDDITGASLRRLTMGFMGPSRQYAYGNLRSLPDGQWSLMSGWWIDGVREDVLLLKLPVFHANNPPNPRVNSTRTPRTDFVPVDVPIPQMQGASRAIVDFGYGEYGIPMQFFCTPRAEACHTVAPAIDSTNPFFYDSEAVQGAACDKGCVLRIPAIAARVLYYRTRYLDSSGAVVSTSPLQIRTSSEERFSGGSVVAVPQ